MHVFMTVMRLPEFLTIVQVCTLPHTTLRCLQGNGFKRSMKLETMKRYALSSKYPYANSYLKINVESVSYRIVCRLLRRQIPMMCEFCIDEMFAIPRLEILH